MPSSGSTPTAIAMRWRSPTRLASRSPRCRCNALQASGCVSTTPSVQVGEGLVAIALDQGTDIIYVVNSSSNTVSVISGATCDALDTSAAARRQQ